MNEAFRNISKKNLENCVDILVEAFNGRFKLI